MESIGGRRAEAAFLVFILSLTTAQKPSLFRKGDLVSAIWHGDSEWYDAQVMRVLDSGRKYRVHYIGYSKEDDETLTADQVAERITVVDVATNEHTVDAMEDTCQLGEDGCPIIQSEGSQRYLVFSSVGDQSLETIKNFWLKDGIEAALFDLVLIFYKSTQRSQVYAYLLGLAESHPRRVRVVARKGLKWDNFRWWMKGEGGAENVGGLYRGIWVPDDDMRMTTQNINNLFEILHSRPNVLIASPSFIPGSEGVWRYHDTHRSDLSIQYTNFVENSCVYFNPAILLHSMFQKCLEAVISGCYFDFCFFAAVDFSESAIAIVHEVKAYHPHRDESRKSELVEELGVAWKDHWRDMESFDAHGVPKDVYWWRNPVHFHSIAIAKDHRITDSVK
ncbi:hypothetical protein AAMO2058_000453300 [Amorphochlora amoebiformis]|mmetsp:Transcript_699/g.983  ORF Transcript_699/g.983 Transcript_699/m.983 type:complete len:391 (-) Transcript_699:79-1251(-)